MSSMYAPHMAMNLQWLTMPIKLPPTRTQPIFIPMSKGWKTVYITEPPKEPLLHKCNHILTIKTLSSAKYTEAVHRIALPHTFANAIIDKESGQVMDYRHFIKSKFKDLWYRLCENEVGCLAHGIWNKEKGTNTIQFIKQDQIPEGEKPTSSKFVVDYRCQKTEKYCTRMMVGGNLIEYSGKVHMPNAALDITKLLFNSVTSTQNAKFCIVDIKIST
eukprot:1838002-Ditylum_brightwellii.AAC.1